jgi:hypothetical protein
LRLSVDFSKNCVIDVVPECEADRDLHLVITTLECDRLSDRGARMKSLFLAILLVSAGVVHADTLPPALVWSGTETDSGGSFLDGSVQAPIVFTPPGLVVDAQENGFTDYTVTTGFTVTASGDFLFSSSAYYSPREICSLPSCEIGFFASFSGKIEILDSGNNQVFSELLSDSGSPPFDCDPSCAGSLWLSDSDFGIVDLPIGNYTLEVNYSDNQDGAPAFGNNEVEANLVPTPEPHELGLLIIGLALILLAKARVFRADGTERHG